ncbi:unnamed protein product [Trichogramma brassicae]|uniref:Uncharacterized protein n=1 Tax=Trichogramma brassicae TaxID=86971 RepID=A0A6H5IA73_9HYME|nr:unnamed protein product [Trichogramma brassicae]
MPAMCDHAADGSEKGDTTIDDGIVQDRRFTKLKENESLNPYSSHITMRRMGDVWKNNDQQK